MCVTEKRQYVNKSNSPVFLSILLKKLPWIEEKLVGVSVVLKVGVAKEPVFWIWKVAKWWAKFIFFLNFISHFAHCSFFSSFAGISPSWTRFKCFFRWYSLSNVSSQIGQICKIYSSCRFEICFVTSCIDANPSCKALEGLGTI